jgi:Flp pilus assembly protein TadG
VTVRAGERGQALVELALVSTAVLFLLFGTLDFGRALYAYDFVAQAARSATRYAIVNAGPCAAGGSTAPCESAIQAAIYADTPGVDTAKLQPPVFTWEGADASCPGTAQPGCTVTVEIDYPFTFTLPIPAVTLKATSQMVISQ